MTEEVLSVTFSFLLSPLKQTVIPNFWPSRSPFYIVLPVVYTGICAVACLWVAQLWRQHEVTLWWFAVKRQSARTTASCLTTKGGGVCVLSSVGFDQ